MSYNVYLEDGGQSLSASSECLESLSGAKAFVDAMILEHEHDREQARQERASDDLLKDSGIL